MNDKTEITILEAVNWTFLGSFTLFLIAVLTAILKLYGSKTKLSEQSLRDSEYIKGLNSDLGDLKDKVIELDKKSDLNQLTSDTNSQSIRELKRDRRELVQRLDNLLQNFMDFIDN